MGFFERHRKLILWTTLTLLLLSLALGIGLGIGLKNKTPTSTTNLLAHPSLKTTNGNAAEIVASDIPLVRGLIYDNESGHILALGRENNEIVAIAVSPPSKSDYSKTVVVRVTEGGIELTHGLAVREGWVYASTSSSVYRWPYKFTQNENMVMITPVEDDEEAVKRQIVVERIDDLLIPGDTKAGHITRSLTFSHHNQGDDAYLYVSVGSAGNVDPDSHRARIRRFDVSQYVSDVPFDFQNGEVVADGLRNAVAMVVNSEDGAVWVAVNGPDNLDRPDLGPGLVEDNPVEPIYKLRDPQSGSGSGSGGGGSGGSSSTPFYGYPYCWPSHPSPPLLGNLYAWPTFLSTHTDAWCQDPTNVIPPTASLTAHSAPMSMAFHPSTGALYISLHGSWNRDTPSGYSVVKVGMTNGQLDSTFVDEVVLEDDNTRPIRFRPTGLVFVGNVMYVASDTTGEIVRLET
ncbi:hypothetical protein BC832DRAFT_557798 [Gaertneriomyces semiglobifer]|nr:hypothetical protein BC832DRAFT_557798 [Gaertneriomyces semiglobifer]